MPWTLFIIDAFYLLDIYQYMYVYILDNLYLHRFSHFSQNFVIETGYSYITIIKCIVRLIVNIAV